MNLCFCLCIRATFLFPFNKTILSSTQDTHIFKSDNIINNHNNGKYLMNIYNNLLSICKNLTIKNITEIPSDIFTNITNIYLILTGLDKVCSNAFKNCTITHFFLPHNINIEKNAFSKIENMHSLKITVTKSNNADHYTTISWDVDVDVICVHIDNNAFKGLTNFTSIGNSDFEYYRENHCLYFDWL